jgi:hypothetical protein
MAIYTIVEASHPMGVRQVYYQLVMHHGLEKTEKNCGGLVGRLLVEMRRGDAMPVEWIDDGGSYHGSPQYSSLHNRLTIAAQTYRRQRWATQPVYVTVFVEKDGLTGTIVQATDPLHVKLWSGGGSASLSQVYRCAQDLRTNSRGKRGVVVLYLADYDPHGYAIADRVEKDLRRWAPDVDLDFRLLALTRRQIDDWGLPSRPTKRNPHDHVAAKWTGGDSTDLDAIDPAQLQELVHEAITTHIDWDAWRRDERRERREQRRAQSLADTLINPLTRRRGG